ncbi:MAG: hypothetical protein ACOX7W_06730, partial [Christensenellales bacterium]
MAPVPPSTNTFLPFFSAFSLTPSFNYVYYYPESVNNNRQEAQQKPVGYGKMEGVHGKITAP